MLAYLTWKTDIMLPVVAYTASKIVLSEPHGPRSGTDLPSVALSQTLAYTAKHECVARF